MDPAKLFNYIKEVEYIKTGLDVDYAVIPDDEEKIVYLLFQESESQQDWKINLGFPCKVYKKQERILYIHQGYVKAWKSCNDEVMTKFILELNEHIGYRPIIAGWSYGGAMSQLAAEDFNYRTGRKAEVITFGSAKISYFLTTKNTIKNCCMKITQYAQPNDFVTWCVPLFFIHHINKVTCGEKFNIRKIFHTSYYHCNYDKVL